MQIPLLHMASVSMKGRLSVRLWRHGVLGGVQGAEGLFLWQQGSTLKPLTPEAVAAGRAGRRAGRGEPVPVAAGSDPNP